MGPITDASMMRVDTIAAALLASDQAGITELAQVRYIAFVKLRGLSVDDIIFCAIRYQRMR